MTTRLFSAIAGVLTLSACSAPVPRDAGKGHLMAETTARAPASDIPAPVQNTLNLPKPRPSTKAETYSVVVNAVPANDLLFALARDAKINVDIHPDIRGTVTLNAIDQTLPQLLGRIAKQIDMRFELDGPNLSVMPDSPFLRNYKVDYVNLARTVTGTVSANSQISTGAAGASGSAGGGNISNTRIENTSKNQFWETLEKNIKDLLRETDKVLPEGTSETTVEQSGQQNSSGAAAMPQSTGQKAVAAIANALANNPSPTSATQTSGSTVVRRNTFREAASVIMNAESGTISVRATGRQHEKIQEFLDRVINSARRQVMIETTILEVSLNDGYQQGINWSRLRTNGSGFEIIPPGTGSSGPASSTVSPFQLKLTQKAWPLNLTAAINLLETFGTTKVLSSPRLSVLNNQTALLKVVENVVYFSVKADTIPPSGTSSLPLTTVTTTPQSVSVGLVMTVTPQISDSDSVTLNIRPTISSVSDWRLDPNPANKTAGVDNWVPQIRTREIESVMRVSSGDIAVLGGLMEDSSDYKTGRVPVLGQIPVVGELLTKRDNNARKTELVIFIRPVVIKDASLAGDYSGVNNLLPDSRFFTPPREAAPFNSAPSQ